MELREVSVVLVDDEEGFLNPLMKRLNRRNISVKGFTAALKAIEHIKGNKVDVVLMDVKMPKMDGIAALREIKKLSPHVEVILLSGMADMSLAVEGLKLGAFDYIVKPVELDSLVYKIHDAAKQKQLHEMRMQSALRDLEI